MPSKFPRDSISRAQEPSTLYKKTAQSFGIASLLLVTNYGQFLGGGSDARMHTPFLLTSICIAQILDLAIVALLLLALLLLLSRLPGYRWTRLTVALVLPVYLVRRTDTLIPPGSDTRWAFGAAAIWAASLLLLFLLRPAWYEVILRTTSALCAFFALFAALSIGQLLWVSAWTPASNQTVADWENPRQPPREHPRIVWIVFDELSYAQLYEKRAANLQLPHFDELARESTVFTNVQPAGSRTEKILPSLLSGRIVDGLRFSFRNRLAVHNQDRRGWHPLTGSGTVFGDARLHGWRTAAVGWYNPYCSVYRDALDDCYWTDLDEFDGPMSPTATFWQNVSTPLVQLVRELGPGEKANVALCDYDVRDRLKTEMDLQPHSFQMLRTDQADLMFIHLGVPHSPNIWSRADNAYTQHCGSSYLDSLALADRLLGEIMTTLKASPRWSQTTVVVQGDHSWRTQIWEGLPAWTAEDERASGGVFDPRPAMIIHRAGQISGELENEPWPLIRVHDVVEGVLRKPDPGSPNPHFSGEGSGPR